MHATTPHLASGAGIGIESAIVLAEELLADSDLQTALNRFEARRWKRCQLVVENSARLCEIEKVGVTRKSMLRSCASPLRHWPSPSELNESLFWCPAPMSIGAGHRTRTQLGESALTCC
ncbi:hypothetical protein QZH46_09000 [Pseudomonas corrugata]